MDMGNRQVEVHLVNHACYSYESVRVSTYMLYKCIKYVCV